MVAFVIAASAAFAAYPTLLGPSGGVVLPDADVTAAGQWNVAVDYYDQTGTSSYDIELKHAIPVRVLYGMGDKLEVGAMFTFQDTNDAKSDDIWSVNAKYLTSLTLGSFNWSVGGLYAKYTDWDDQILQFYFVGTRVLSEGSETSPAVSGSIGVNWTQDDDTGYKADAFRPYFSLNAAFKGGTELLAEYQFKNDNIYDQKAIASIGVRHAFNPNWSAQIAFTNAEIVYGIDDYNFLLGVNYKLAAK